MVNMRETTLTPVAGDRIRVSYRHAKNAITIVVTNVFEGADDSEVRLFVQDWTDAPTRSFRLWAGDAIVGSVGKKDILRVAYHASNETGRLSITCPEYTGFRLLLPRFDEIAGLQIRTEPRPDAVMVPTSFEARAG